MKFRDSNHSIRFHVARLRRLFRSQLRGELLAVFNEAADLINASMRVLLGAAVIVFELLAGVCRQWKKSFYRERTQSRKRAVRTNQIKLLKDRRSDGQQRII